MQFVVVEFSTKDGDKAIDWPKGLAVPQNGDKILYDGRRYKVTGRNCLFFSKESLNDYEIRIHTQHED